MALVLIVSLGWWEQKAESILATACMNHPSEQFDSERVTGGKTKLNKVGENLGFAQVVESSLYFRRNHWGRWNSRARREEGQGLRGDKCRFREERMKFHGGASG